MLLFPLLDRDDVAQGERRAPVAQGQPVRVAKPTLAHFKKLFFDTPYPEWMWNTVVISVIATFTSIAASVFAAYAIERLRFRGSKQIGLAIFLAYSCRRRSSSSRSRPSSSSSVSRHALGLILAYLSS